MTLKEIKVAKVWLNNMLKRIENDCDEHHKDYYKRSIGPSIKILDEILEFIDEQNIKIVKLSIG